MKRRSVILGGAGIALGSTLMLRPKESGGPHNPYFANLNALLKRSGPGNPSMLIDLDNMNANIDLLAKSVGPNKTYRIVVKSLPSIDLVKHIMSRANTKALMLFHQPFVNAVAQAIPDADVLIGKPMPLAAVENFYKKLDRSTTTFNPETQLQWLVDTPERLIQYQYLARQLGIKMQVNLELDVGLHRGGFSNPSVLSSTFKVIETHSEHLSFTGFMGYEPHLSGLEAGLSDTAVQSVLSIYRGFIDAAKQEGINPSKLTLNGAGSHTLKIYEKDNLMNDLSAGSGVLKPVDFDTYHLRDNKPALYIGTPILKRYDKLQLPVHPIISQAISTWDPNRRRLFYIYGGYWKAKFVSPAGVPDAIYHSTNQEPVTTSTLVDLKVDDYMFLRPTQSEHVMLQFGDLLVFKDQEFVAQWPVFQETG